MVISRYISIESKGKVITHGNSEILEIIGSIPKGVPDTIYRSVKGSISLASKDYIDTEGSLLLEV